MEVLKCLGQTESPVLRPRWGIGSFYTGSHVQEKSRQGYRIRAITLFGLQGSYLFAWFDMFLLTRGVVLYGKPIVLKCIYLFCRQNSLTEQGWGEKEIVCQVFQRVRSLFCPSMLRTESCGVVVGGEDMSSICLCSSLDQNTTLASNRC